MYAMLMTLSNYKPTYQDRVAPPGNEPNPMMLKILHAQNDNTTYSAYVDHMKAFLKAYDKQRQNTPQTYKDRGELEGSQGVRKACRFDREWLKDCSGLKDDTFGFKEGKPCLIIKLNRIVNFRPRVRNSGNVNLVICCKLYGLFTSKNEDAKNVGPVNFFGLGPGFPLQYYPYYGKLLHPNYLQPLVAVKFNVSVDTEMRIECKVFGQNIAYNEKDRYQGRFDVKITVRS
uniref:Sodium/potassium-transporting ATPase subunit beta n=1 Tax=Cyprinus carpio TaxID=7962 RepID=A0A8C2H1Y9_CYPCA